MITKQITRYSSRSFMPYPRNNKHIKEIDDLYEGIKNIQPNKRIPNVAVSNINGETFTLQQIAKDKKAVFYFWSSTYKRHFEDISKQVIQLSKEKPDHTFIGINIKSNEEEWKALILTAGLDDKKPV